MSKTCSLRKSSVPNRQTLIVFDHDGTLVDSSRILYQAYRHVADAHGLPIPPYSDVTNSIGYDDHFTILFGSNEPEYLNTFLGFYYAHHLRLIRPFDGISTLLDHLRKEGYKMGVVSNKLRKAGLAELSACGFSSYFAETVYREDMDQAKPDPQGIHWLQEKFAVQSPDVVLVGDTEVDIQCAKNAGVKTIAALWGYGDESRLASLHPDASSRSPADVSRALAALL